MTKKHAPKPAAPVPKAEPQKATDRPYQRPWYAYPIGKIPADRSV